jgi:DNA-binding PadR family transcriptional regulator
VRRNRAPSSQAIAVLRALASTPGGWRHGYDLCRETELKAGSMYPILMRLADRGQLETKWESDPPAGRPPRHLYRLTAAGRRAAAELSSEHVVNRGAPPRLRVRELKV